MFSKSTVTVDDGGDAEKGAVRLKASMKKLNTMKKKFFIVREESPNAPARLEYYENEKMYESGVQPKRTISLRSCFNINRRTDTKHKHVVALYTRGDPLSIVFLSEALLEEWLKVLLELQSGHPHVDGEPVRPKYEHVWKVKWSKMQSGTNCLMRNLNGKYHYLCLAEHTLSLFRCGENSEKQEPLVFPLNLIRNCASRSSCFYVEVGRHCVTGAAELWLDADDSNIAESIKTIVYKAFSQNKDSRDFDIFDSQLKRSTDEVDCHRQRSASATESSRPTGFLQRRTTHCGGRSMGSMYTGCYITLSEDEQYNNGPKVCVSPPPPSESRPIWAVPAHYARYALLAVPRPVSMRRHSVSAVSSSSVSGHQAVAPAPSTAVSHQRTKSCPVSDTCSVPATVEPVRVLSQSHVAAAEAGRRGSGGGGMRRHVHGKSTTRPRERCDTMPPRHRTISEGTPKPPMHLHGRGLSRSPPGPTPTDSAGSLSMDDSEYDGFTHGPTDDEVIPEENADDASQWSHYEESKADRKHSCSSLGRPTPSLTLPIHSVRRKISITGFHGSPSGSTSSDYLTMSPGDTGRRSPASSDYMKMSSERVNAVFNSPTTSDYMAMSPGEPSKSAIPVTSRSVSSDYMTMSPGEAKKTVPLGTSPSVCPEYVNMSPTANSGQSLPMDYLLMSPSEGHRLPNRGKGREEDGYVRMAPAHSDDGYVDMDPASMHRSLRDDLHSDMSPGSSCSITSGTPSTDFALGRVVAYYTHSEDEDALSMGPPTRTQSFGSQPKPKLDVANAAEIARVRAFSVGTRPPPTHRLPSRAVPPGAKCSSAPMLSGSSSGANRHVLNDPMADHMEMDFSHTKKHGSSKYKALIDSVAAQAHISGDSGYMDMTKSPPKPSSSKHPFSPPDGKSLGTRLPKSSNVVVPSLKTVDECPKSLIPQSFPTSSAYVSPSNKHNQEDYAYMDMSGKNPGKNETNTEALMNLAFDECLPTRDNSLEEKKDCVSMTSGKGSSLPIDIAIRNSSFISLNQIPVSSSSLSSGRKKRKCRKKQERHESSENNDTTPTAIFPMSLNSPSDGETEGTTALSQTEPVDLSQLSASLSRVLRAGIKENTPVNEVAGEVMKHLSSKWGSPFKESQELRPRISSSGAAPSSPRSLQSKSDDEGAAKLAPLAKPESSCLLSDSEGHAGVIRQVSTSSSSSTEAVTYASLDLSEVEAESEPRTPRPSPTPASSTYAEIDFNKSESLRNSQLFKKNIRH